MTDHANEWPRISIVTPSFNQGQFLDSTIRSVLDQGYPNLEYIIVDGGSTDGSVEVMKRYRKQLTWWVSEPDHGQAHALNKGFKQATGDIYAYLNSDDRLATGILFSVGERYRRCDPSNRPDFWISFSLVVCDENGFRRFWRTGAFRNLYSWIYGDAMIPQPASFWSREMHEAIGGFDEQYDCVLDKEFFIRLLLNGYRYDVVPDTVGSFFRLHESSKTITSKDAFDAERRRMIENIEMSGRLPDELLSQIRHQSALGILRRARGSEREKRGWGLLMKALRCEPSIVKDRMFWGAVRDVIRDREHSNLRS